MRLSIILVAFVFLSGCTASSERLEKLQIGDNTLQVVVMRTEAELAQGLSGLEQIPGDGMLFLMPERKEATFWMKDMLFPIDIIWIDGERVIGVAEFVQPPESGQTLDSLPIIRSGEPVTMVLEVPAGDLRRLELATGSAVRLE